MKNSIILLSSALYVGLIGSSQAVTVLVNFGDNVDPSPGTIIAATAADYAVADSGVDLSAPVNLLSGPNTPQANGQNPIPASTISGAAGVSFEFGGANGFAFTPGDTSTFGGAAILDSYVAADDVPINFTLTSLEEIPNGDLVTVTIYAVGDADNQDGSVSLTYDGITQGPVATEADGTGSAFAQFTFTKTDADQIDITNAGVTRFRAINGFSVTSPNTIPEPSSSLLAGLCMVLLTARRRR